MGLRLTRTLKEAIVYQMLSWIGRTLFSKIRKKAKKAKESHDEYVSIEDVTTKLFISAPVAGPEVRQVAVGE